MTLPRLSSRPPAPGEHTSPGAMTKWLTFSTPANPTAGTPAVAAFSCWGAMRAMSGMEMYKAQIIAQRSTHLVTIRYREGVAESMTVSLTEPDGSVRNLQIEFIEDPDEQKYELRMMAFEIGQSAGE